MDTKKLYVKSQKTVLNWGLGVSAFFFLLVIASLFISPKSNNKASLIISIVIYSAMFAFMIINRLKINKSLALLTFGLFAAFTIYSLIDMSIGAKKTLMILQKTSPENTMIMLVLGYVIALVFFTALNLLFYSVFKATKKIEALESIEG